MNLLITPAIKLSPEQKRILGESHNLFYIDTEIEPLSSLNIDFAPEDIEGIICNCFFTANSLSALPNLRLIQLTSVGLERVPVAEIAERGIVMFNAGTTYSVPIAEWVMGKIISVYKRSTYFYETQKKHLWQKNRTLRELSGSRAAIIGFGSIGSNVAKRLKAFDVEIYAVDVAVPSDDRYYDRYYDVSELKEAVSDADIIIISAPLTEKTYHMINGELLACMKEDATLINPSRGALIDEAALIGHIKTHPLFNAAMDVFEEEPLDENSFLWSSEQVLASPHNAFVSVKNSDRLFNLIQNNLKNFN